MLLQCGLGAFAAASLHIVAHSLYKAYAFLSSGSVVDLARAAWTPSASQATRPLVVASSLAAALAATVGVGALLGATPTSAPGVVALAAILAMGVAHLLLQSIDVRPAPAVVLRAAALAGAVAGAYFLLQAGAAALLRGAVAPTVGAHGPGDLVLPVLVVAAFAAMFVAQALLASHGDRPRWRAAYVHLANGLYANTLLNRAVARVWPVHAATRAPSSPASTLARSAA
jgi:NAD(P)H-quinone oxidoreductase subunit 5